MLPQYETLDWMTLAHLRALVETSAPEDSRIEYKGSKAYSAKGAAKKWCKSLSAFANTGGGCILLGVEEEDGCAAELSGLDGDADAIILKLSQWAESGIRPRIVCRHQRIDIGEGREVVLLATPSSRSKPHMVVCDGEGRCYKRAASHNQPMDIDELRDAVMQSDSPRNIALETHRRFIAQGRERLGDHDGTVALTFCPIPSDQKVIDPGRLSLRELGLLSGTLGIPLHSNRTTFDGWENDDGFGSMTQITRIGIIHSSRAGGGCEPEDKLVPDVWLPTYLADSVSFVTTQLAQWTGTTACFVCMSYLNVKGWSIENDDSSRDDSSRSEPITLDHLEFPPIFAEGVDTDSRILIRDWIIQLWQACGIKQSPLYDDDMMPIEEQWDRLRLTSSRSPAE